MEDTIYWKKKTLGKVVEVHRFVNSKGKIWYSARTWRNGKYSLARITLNRERAMASAMEFLEE